MEGFVSPAVDASDETKFAQEIVLLLADGRELRDETFEQDDGNSREVLIGSSLNQSPQVSKDLLQFRRHGVGLVELLEFVTEFVEELPQLG